MHVSLIRESRLPPPKAGRLASRSAKPTLDGSSLKPEPEDLLHPSTDWIEIKEREYDALLTDVELPGIDKDDCMPGLTIHHSVGQQTTIDNGDDPT